MDLRIEPCTAADLSRLLAGPVDPRSAAHHRERSALQDSGEATYLLAWRGAENVGRATLYHRSKYAAVRARHPGTAEINALEATPQGQGIGSALIAAAEAIAARRGHDAVGLAVEPGNSRARRLYERLGYFPWGHGEVIDIWTEPRPGGDVEHRDPCDYLRKALPREDSAPAR
ncbi:GNAT family N-acetyltransferase [Brachybacterium phenoliresistens]|uniref:GNAT family N-acetyltransferase n=1 Tax=Brachybacterium phenoliresistens TaxID=396014 RepID=UPI0031E0594D